MIRKITLQIAVPALLALMAWNAYLAVNHLKRMQKIAALTLESSAIQAGLSGVLKDLTDMETGQRGFLVTGDSTSLKRYSDAKGRIETDLAGLRVRLANRAQREQSMLSQVESLAKSKQAEMDRSITLRQHGYRHRSFMLVNTNECNDYMNEVRRIMSSLSSAETGNFVRFEADTTAQPNNALS